MNEFPAHLTKLSLFRKFIEHAEVAWPTFLEARSGRLVQEERYSGAAEKVAENILEDFFTIALDWRLEHLNNQVHYADLVLTTNGIKRLIVEVKRPRSLSWNQTSLERALDQARRYADEQRVASIAVSDGYLFYAADIVHGGLEPRARLQLDAPAYSPNSWWVSIEGVYRQPELLAETGRVVSERAARPSQAPAITEPETADADLLHPKYKVPARCFAYVKDATDPKTWKLPCWLITGEVDTRRLPGAIRSVVSTYRGTRAHIPEQAIPDVVVRLGKAAAAAKELPGQTGSPKASYQQLYDVLVQLDRVKEVL